MAAALSTPDQRVAAAVDGAGRSELADGIPGGPAPDGPAPDEPAPDEQAGGPASPSPGADLALQVTLAAGCDAAAAGAAVRRAADALLAATGDRLRRGVEVSVVQAGRTADPA